jgi:hypothetical protein
MLWTAHAGQVIPGARNRWIVTMRFKPVGIDAKPTMTMPITVATTWAVDAEVLSGPSETPGRAPIMSGTTKLPSTAGIHGIRT